MAHVDIIYIDIVRVINDAHRRILAAEAAYDSKPTNLLGEICGKPYAFECACALANDKTASLWFVGACARGVWRLMRWLLLVFGDASLRRKNLAFSEACVHRRGAVAKWLLNIPWYAAENEDYLLQLASNNGMFRVVRYILGRYDRYFRERDRVTSHKRRVLSDACARRCIWFIRWLDNTYGLTRDDVCHDQMYAFACACAYGHWPLARWMAIRFGLTREDIRTADCQPLVITCMNGHMTIARWLVERFRLTARDVRGYRNAVFIHTCMNGQLEMAQWLADRFCLTTWDARWEHNVAVIRAAQTGHMSVARWLVERFGLGREGARVDCSRHVLKGYDAAGPVESIKWLIATFEPHLRREPEWYDALVAVAADAKHAEFTVWMVKRFGIIPCAIKPTLYTYKRTLVWNPDDTRATHAQQWFDTYAADW